MVKGIATLARKGGGLGPAVAHLQALARREVYVGIPAEESTRENGGEINNAELLYIHTHGVRRREMREEMDKNIAKGMKYSKAHSLYIQAHGSPLWQAPPRPVLEPAVEAYKAPIGAELAKASRAALNGDAVGAERALNLAGMVAQNAARGWFEDARNGWAPNAPSTIKRKGSDSPLIDTGEMRKAIVYVVRDK